MLPGTSTHANAMDQKLSGPGTSGRLEELDSLRGLAALSVVLFHFKELWVDDVMRSSSNLSKETFTYLVYPFTAGYEAVMLFFILSGFVLSIPAIHSRAQKYSVFLVRRIFRIYMPYLVALALAVTGDMFLHGHVTQGGWFNQFWSTPVNWHLVLNHVLFIGKYDTNQLNPPIWSLIYEMRISLVFPLLCAIALWFRPIPSLILAFVMSCASIVITNVLFVFHIRTSIIDTLHYAALFVIGIYLARQKTAIS
jgi:peptidoglycan/LPS O-acetylase OafA/YrhL